MRARSLLLLLPLFLASCDRDVVVIGEGFATKIIPVSPDLDVLFVIDNSLSTADKQIMFAQAFPTFVTALDSFPAGRPNLHIGVVSSTVDLGVGVGPGCPSPDFGDNGLLQNTPRVQGCTGPTGQFIADISDGSGRTTNYNGTLQDELSCIAQLGDAGCGFEAPMLAIQRALDGTNPDNAGFLRPDADLAIVILADEDDASVVDPSLFSLPPQPITSDFRAQPLVAYDCDQPISADEPGTYTNCHTHPGGYLLDPHALAETLATIKDPSMTSVGLVAGDPETTIATGPLTINSVPQPMALLPSCTATINGNPAIGRPAIRLASFAAEYAERGTFHTVCQPDYGEVLTDESATMFEMMSPCLAANADPGDTDSTNPGIQPACTVSDRANYGTPQEQDTLMPPCTMIDPITPSPDTVQPCWWVESNPTSCPAPGSPLELNIVRDIAPPPGSVVGASCAATGGL